MRRGERGEEHDLEGEILDFPGAKAGELTTQRYGGRLPLRPHLLPRLVVCVCVRARAPRVCECSRVHVCVCV